LGGAAVLLDGLPEFLTGLGLDADHDAVAVCQTAARDKVVITRAAVGVEVRLTFDDDLLEHQIS